MATVYTFDYTGAVQTVTLPKGTYKLQVWGAQGGSYNSSYQGGLGGYSEGVLKLTAETTAYVYVGGQPAALTTSTDPTVGGFNGGGLGEYTTYKSTTTYAQSGGGGTDIRIGTDSLYARVIVAGGGAGASNSYNAKTTRCGGGLTSQGYLSTYQATQTSGNAFGVGQNGKDVANYKYTSAGSGGGWYGGKSEQSYSDSTNYSSYTAGGSGYVYTSESAVNYPEGCLLNESYYLEDAQTLGYADSTSWPTTDGTSTELGHSGNGYVIITPTISTTPQFYVNGEFVNPSKIYAYVDGSFKECTVNVYQDGEFVEY